MGQFCGIEHLLTRRLVVTAIGALVLGNPCASWAAQDAGRGLPTWELAHELTMGARGDVKAIGGSDLASVRDIARGPRGGYYILQSGTPEVWVFDQSGRFSLSFGQEGQGPGDFARPMRLGWRGDTLWVADTGLNRISLFDSSGNPIDSKTFNLMYGLSRVVPVHMAADGSIISITGASVRYIAEGSLKRAPVLRCTWKGHIANVIAWRTFRRSHVAYEVTEGRAIYRRHPLSSSTIGAIDPHGRFVVTIEWQEATPGTVGISAIAVAGDTLATKDLYFDPILVTRRQARRIEEEERAVLEESSVSHRTFKQVFSLPDYVRPVTAAVVSDDGTIWISRQQSGNDAYTVWLVLNDQLEPVAFVKIPKGSRLLRVGVRQLWVERLGPFDIPTVEQYRIERRDGQRP